MAKIVNKTYPEKFSKSNIKETTLMAGAAENGTNR